MISILILLLLAGSAQSFVLSPLQHFIARSKSKTKPTTSASGLCAEPSNNNEAIEVTNFKDSLWSDRVEYVDLMAIEESPTPNTRSLPLFLLSGTFYPSGTSLINVFEMKYRTMMFDCANSDDIFGYIQTDRSGRIAKYGTMCKIVDRQLLEDGRQFIGFDGVGRFKVKKILKTLPYVLAEVEANISDEEVSSEETVIKVEQNVYNLLKYYIRLMKKLNPRRELVISQVAKKTRPDPTSESSLRDGQRRTQFSFALANMIQMSQEKESQLILQTTNIMKRLQAQEQILTQACELVATELKKSESFTDIELEDIRALSFNTSMDEDILPPEVKDNLSQDAEKDEWDISNIE